MAISIGAYFIEGCTYLNKDDLVKKLIEMRDNKDMSKLSSKEVVQVVIDTLLQLEFEKCP